MPKRTIKLDNERYCVSKGIVARGMVQANLLEDDKQLGADTFRGMCCMYVGDGILTSLRTSNGFLVDRRLVRKPVDLGL